MKNLKYLLVLLITVTATVSCVIDDNVYEAPSPWVAVTSTTINYTNGPITSISFPSNPIPGEDVNVVLTYASTETILEARIYFSNGNSPVYVKANKIKGEDDATFTQTSVTINMKDQSTAGEKTWFYVRLATGSAEYYFGKVPGGMHLDDTPGGGTTDDSDAFKDNPTTHWNIFTPQSSS